ncbi:phage tail tape measure protein [Lactobacillus sp. PV037]|uniref:phage tail tape measure protein n=1 Tax=Lactobacillus sp. PV037 TaxID=2594496 RepID=UPI00223EB89C|nr:phage tail tape measure protein [Lactobacillus sp. PV037]QNQ83754.1 phage tail tape measure protein [Lactobacillus sp. PV037]
MPVIEGYRFAISLEDRGMTRGLRVIKNEAQALKTVMRANFATLREGEGTVSAYSQRIKDAANTSETYKIAIEKLQKNIQAWKQELKQSGEENNTLNGKIARAINTINRYKNAIAQLDHQMQQDKLAVERAKTGIDAFRKSTESITTANKAWTKSLEESGSYYKAERSRIQGLKTERESLKSQLKAEIKVTEQLGNYQKKLQSNYQTTRLSLEKNEKALNGNSKELIRARNNYNQLSNKLGENDSKTQEAKEALEKLRQEYNKVSEAIEQDKAKLHGLSEELGKSAKTYANQAAQTEKVAGNLKKVSKEASGFKTTRLASFSTTLKGMRNELKQNTGATKEWASSVKGGFGIAAAGIGGVGVAATESVKKAAGLQQTYKEITNLAVVGGEQTAEATKSVTAMQKDGREMSLKYGLAQKDIAEGYEDLIKRGYSTKQAMGAMRSEVEASVATGDTFSDVTTVASQTLEGFGLKSKSTAQMLANTKKVTNELAYAADATSTGFHDLGIGMSYVNSTAHQAGFSLNETAAAMGILSNNGLEADKAGTGLRKVINSLSSAVKKIDEKDSPLKKLGITKDELVKPNGQLKSLTEIMGVLGEKTKGLSRTEKTNIFQSLFGTTGQQAGMILAENVKDLADISKKTKEAGDSGTYVHKIAQKNMATTQGQLKRLKAVVDDTAINIGKNLLPSVNKAAKYFADWAVSKEGQQSIKDVSNLVTGLVTTVTKHIPTIISFVTGVGSGLKTVWNVIKPIAKGIGTVARALGLSDKNARGFANGLGKVVGVVAGITLSVKTFKTLIGGVVALGKDGVGLIKTIGGWFSKLRGKQSDVNTTLKETNKLLEEQIRIQKEINGLANDTERTVARENKDLNNINKNGGSGGDLMSDAVDAVGDVAEAKGGKEGKVAKDIEKLGGKHGNGYKKGFKSKLSKVNPKNWSIFKKSEKAGTASGMKSSTGFLGKFKSGLSKINPKNWGIFKGLGKAGATGGAEAGTKATTGILGKLGKAGSKLKPLGKGLFGSFFNGWNLGFGLADDAFNIVDGIKERNPEEKSRKIGSGIGGGVGAGVGAALGSVIPGAGTLAGAALGETIGSAVGKYWPEIKRGFSGVFNFGKKVAKGAFDTIGKAVGPTVNKIKKGDWKGAWNDAVKFGKNAFSKTLPGQVFNFVGKAVNKIKKAGWKGAWSSANSSIRSTFGKTNLGHATSFVSKTVGYIRKGNWKGAWSNAQNSIKSTFGRTSLGHVTSFVGKAVNSIKKGGWKKTIKDTMDGAINTAKKQWNGFSNWFNKNIEGTGSKSSSTSSSKSKSKSSSSNTVSERIIKSGTKVTKAEIANVNKLSAALKGYAKNLKIVHDEMKSDQVEKQLESVNKFLIDHTKGWKKVADQVRDIGNAFKYLATFANSMAKKDAFEAFNRDLPKLDRTLKSHAKSIKRGLNTLNDAFKGTKGKSGLVSTINSLKTAFEKFTSKVKALNDKLNKTASDFKAIGKVTKQFTGRNNPFDKMAKGLDNLKKALTNDTKKITEAVKKIRDAFQGTKKQKTLASLFTDAKKPLDGLTKDFRSLSKDAPKAGKGFQDIKKSIEALSKGGGSGKGKKNGSILSQFQTDLDKLTKTLKTDSSKMVTYINKITKAIGKSGKKGSGLVKAFSDTDSSLKSTDKELKNSSKNFDRLYYSVRDVAKKLQAVSKAAKDSRDSLKKLISYFEKAEDAIDNVYSAITKHPFGDEISDQAKYAVETLKSDKGNYTKRLKTMNDDALKNQKEFSSKYQSEWKSMWSKNESAMSTWVRKTLSSLSSFNSKFKSGWNSVARGVKSIFSKMWSTMKTQAGKGMNSVLSILNQAIGKVDGVISSFGGTSSAVSKVSYVKYATGTGAFSGVRRPITEPTLAMLNDGNDSPETGNKEAIWRPSTGLFGVVDGRNTKALLMPGDEVFNATETKALMAQRGIKHYATGTGWLSTLSDFANNPVIPPNTKSEKVLKKWYDLAEKLGSHSEQGLKSLTQFSANGVKGAMLQLAEGVYDKTYSNMSNWWQQLWKMTSDKLDDGDSVSNSGLLKAMEKYGSGKPYVWGATGAEAFDCSGLVQYSLENGFKKAFPRTSGEQYAATQHISQSNAKPGDLVFFGPGGSEHVGVYAGGDNYYSAQNPQDGIGMGKISAFGSKPLFGRIPGMKFDNNNTPTIKTNSKLQAQIKNQVGKGYWNFISKLADVFGLDDVGGNAASISMIESAARKMKVSLPSGFAKKLMQVIMSESGNRSVIQSIHDVNSGGNEARGILQYTPPTFAAYAMPGHNHIMHPYDQLLAFFNNSDWANSIGWTTIWGVRKMDWLHSGPQGHRRFANGGFSAVHQMAEISEGNKPEAIIPLDLNKRSRAQELLADVLAVMGGDTASGSNLSSNLNKIVTEFRNEQKKHEKFEKELLKVIKELVNKPEIIQTTVNIDGQKVARQIDKYIRKNQTQRYINGQKGVTNGF